MDELKVVVSVRVNEETKAKMDALRDISWSEIIRRAIEGRIETEERLRKQIDGARALRASEDMERLRAKTSGRWSGVEEIRRWREARR